MAGGVDLLMRPSGAEFSRRVEVDAILQLDPIDVG